MKVTFVATGFQFKRAEFSDAFKKAIQLEMRNGAKEFVKAALIRVPVRTGFARGTLLNLGDAIGYAGATNKPAFARKLDKRRLKVVNVSVNGAEEYYQGVPKTPENARQFSTPLNKVFTNNGRTFSFNYEQTVLYYEINDASSNRYTPSAPWRSFEFGSAAFIDYLERVGLQRLPAITEYIVKKRIS
jgi:hypothetical protein